MRKTPNLTNCRHSTDVSFRSLLHPRIRQKILPFRTWFLSERKIQQRTGNELDLYVHTGTPESPLAQWYIPIAVLNYGAILAQ